jgi:hypothetical protein
MQKPNPSVRVHPDAGDASRLCAPRFCMNTKEGLMTTNRCKNSGILFIPGWIALALAMLFTGLQPASLQAKSKSLTPKTVKQFIASYPDVRKIAVHHAAATGADVATAKDKFAAVIQVASDKSLARKVDAAVQPHGFNDTKEWMSVAESVGQAYAHIKAGGDDKAKRKLEKAISKINKMSFLSDKQKDKLAKEMREKAGALLDPPPPENIAAVEPMVGEIEAVVK